VAASVMVRQQTKGALKSNSNTQGSDGIPFIDIDGSYVLSGASFSPQVLSGMIQDQVAAPLSDPASPSPRLSTAPRTPSRRLSAP
jgi:hypothetical protein